ncbi:MAG TPA: DciA family protein [Jatrophihabitantaceae bacterium]|nr:DciA family protein [Jatrophihabitantaceae bacterium]
MARQALEGARKMARGRRTGRTTGRPRRRDGDQRSAGGYSGPAPDEVDPQPVGALLSDYVEERGWERPLAEARVFADWAGVVGPDVAAHSAPVALAGGELKVQAESTAWATQLRLLTATLLARLADELGPEVVTRISISGPTGPSWKHGGYSVRGARGPRDTYG